MTTNEKNFPSDTAEYVNSLTNNFIEKENTEKEQDNENKVNVNDILNPEETIDETIDETPEDINDQYVQQRPIDDTDFRNIIGNDKPNWDTDVLQEQTTPYADIPNENNDD